MSFDKLDKPAQPERIKTLTVEQKNLICDLYAQGISHTKIKHAIGSQFNGPFHHLIKPAFSKMKEIEENVKKEIIDSKSLIGLKTKIGKTYTDCDKESLDHLIDKILKVGTDKGTYSEYKSRIAIINTSEEIH